MPGPAAKPLVLSDHERSVLLGWVRRPTSSARLVQRSKIVLAYADDPSVAGVAKAMGVSAPTVSKWRDRFLADRLDGLEDAPRPGQPRKMSDEQIEALISRTLEGAPPNGDTHWSTRSMAADQGLNQTQVSRIWRAFGLKPHAVDSWKLSKDPQFVDKVRDIVGLYMSPPENALVLAVDEKSQVQALDRTAPILPMMPTTPARATHDYVRHGTTTLFAAMDIISGSVIARNYRRHRSTEFLRFLKEVDAATPKGLELHLVLDNYATHKTPKVKEWLLKHPRVVLHFTPTSASWLNLVERWFAELTRRKLQRSTHRSVVELERDIIAWTQNWNQNPKPFVWTKTADAILETLASYCKRINDSRH